MCPYDRVSMYVRMFLCVDCLRHLVSMYVCMYVWLYVGIYACLCPWNQVVVIHVTRAAVMP